MGTAGARAPAPGAGRARGRYRLYCPWLGDDAPGRCLNVHSKVLVIDDEIVSVSSANHSTAR
jgi:phosphatidylserine/phosphatidylglycerophosphate/cardiolipin synthase-like enzyme